MSEEEKKLRADSNEYKQEFMKRTYDRLSVYCALGMKMTWQRAAENRGFKSMNEYINHLVTEDIKKYEEEHKGGSDNGAEK